MIDLNNIMILNKNKSTLKNTSKREHEGVDIFMTQSHLEVVDFDAVKLEYCKGIGASETPASSDALFIDDQGECFFIEFKDGFIDKKKCYEIWLKIYDSLLIFTDIIGDSISFTRKKLNFILVYNENKNPLPEGINEGMQVSTSRLTIAEHFLERKARKKFIRFDLERFEKLYFANVYTFNEAVFESEFVLKHSP